MEHNDFTEDRADDLIPDFAAVRRFSTAISHQKKWSPDEVMPRWGLALSVMRDETINLSFKR